uniref:Uncharacterized protein n=2 Tax=Lotharella globosa TaxID=91324 RepID=A0A7S3Z0I8_9EUKA
MEVLAAALSPLIFPTIYARSQRGGVPLGSGMAFVVAASICAVALLVASLLPDDPPPPCSTDSSYERVEGLGPIPVTPGTGVIEVSREGETRWAETKDHC